MKEKSKKLRILAAGDFHGDSKAAERLAKKATKEKVDVVILTGDLIGLAPSENIIKPFIERKQKVVFVPGNWESRIEVESFTKKYDIKNLGDHYLKYGDVGLIGTDKGWTLYLDEEGILKRLKRDFDKMKNLEKKVMVSHFHASGTKSELSGFEGSQALRKAIDKFKPDLFIHSHIHELEGIEEKIGQTKVINVGKKGRIIDI